MNNIVVLNALNLSEYAYKELYDGKSAAAYAASAAESMPDCSRTAILLSEDADAAPFAGFDLKRTPASKPEDLVAELASLSEGFDNIIYYQGDCALIDLQLTEKMYANHKKYFCEYTFADGYPEGISPEIIKPAILPMLAKLAEGDEGRIGRKTVFSLIEKDINAFELETEISPDDQRLLRVGLYPDTKRNFFQLKDIFYSLRHEGVKDNTASAVLETVRKKGCCLRTLPAFYEFETTSAHPQAVSYMPENGGISKPGGAEMSVSDFSKAVAAAAEFSEDAVISLSIRNEPSLHTSPAELAESVLSHEKLELLIETSGIGWKDEQLDRILSLGSDRITWIIDLDALDRSLYEKLRGDGYDEAFSFADRMLSRSPDNVWVQTVRMRENEEDNEQFYKYWKEKTNNVIIQKYDWCCGMLEQRKVTDLSPLKRLPCWHLKRELAVLSDGRVPLCRDDLRLENVLGNLFVDDLSMIWKNADGIYRQHLDEEYPGICRNCDEYYTYNY